MPVARRRPLALVATVLAVLLVVAACGDDSTSVSSDSGSDPDTAILVVGHEGGFTTPEFAFSTLPQLVVYADGRVIQMGAQIAIYPGPALPPLFVSQLSAAGLDAVRAALTDSGLDVDDVDYGMPPIADAGQTVVTVRIDGTTYTHRAEALGFDDGLDDDQRANRARLQRFADRVTDLQTLVGPGNLSGEVAYEVDRFRLWVRPASEVDGGMEVPEGEPAPREADWTVESVPLEASDCLAVEGDSARDVYALLDQADQLTRFVSNGTSYAVTARPVLPHEPTCP
jgi:hypothetical protein